MGRWRVSQPRTSLSKDTGAHGSVGRQGAGWCGILRHRCEPGTGHGSIVSSSFRMGAVSGQGGSVCGGLVGGRASVRGGTCGTPAVTVQVSPLLPLLCGLCQCQALGSLPLYRCPGTPGCSGPQQRGGGGGWIFSFVFPTAHRRRRRVELPRTPLCVNPASPAF